jgi:hypothetical protein
MIEYRVKETGTIISKYIRVAGVPYAVGDQVRLFYDPLKPQRIQLDYKKGFIPMLIFTSSSASLFAGSAIKYTRGFSQVNSERSSVYKVLFICLN